jgi:hypothetical protein
VNLKQYFLAYFIKTGHFDHCLTSKHGFQKSKDSDISNTKIAILVKNPYSLPLIKQENYKV